jgi:hypothetical protein
MKYQLSVKNTLTDEQYLVGAFVAKGDALNALIMFKQQALNNLKYTLKEVAK